MGSDSYDGHGDYGGGADYSEGTYEALKADIADMFLDSKDFWPADFGALRPPGGSPFGCLRGHLRRPLYHRGRTRVAGG